MEKGPANARPDFADRDEACQPDRRPLANPRPLRVKILIVYNSALDARSVSGVQRYFTGVVNQWIADGHVVDFLVARAAWPVFREQFPQSRLISSDDVFDFTRNLRQTWRYLPAFAWRMVTPHFVRLPERYDAVLACAQFIYEVRPALTLARRMNAAMAIKIHHVVSAQRAPSGFFDRLHFWSEHHTAKLLNRHADLILCGTPLIAADYRALEERLGLKPSATVSTGYGVDLSRLTFSADGPKEFDAVLLGRVHEHKGVFDAPPLWQAVRSRRSEAKLLVIGEGPHREELRRRFAALGLGEETGAVKFTGGISDAEKDALLARCRIGLSLSREEGWGLSITEFLAVGLPVVAMDLPIFRQVFPAQLDLVPQRDPAAAAGRVLHWLEHPEPARERAAQGREFVARYDHREVARQELAALRGAIERRRQSNR